MLRSALVAKLSKEKKPKQKPEKPTKKTPKKTPKSPSLNHVFDEEIKKLSKEYQISPDGVAKGIEGLIKFTSENPKLKNKLFEDEQLPIFLQINSIKVPQGHSRIVRIPLKHSLLTPDSEVCLIVADVKGVPNKNHDEHLEHYEKLLRQKGVTNIKKIMTFHEFRTEYETFEMRSRLVELYDAFLVDGKISGKTVKKCGKIFYKKRKVPSAIKLRATKLKEHIEQTLKKTPLYLHQKGDSFVVQIGHSKMPTGELVENVFCIAKGLQKEFPGGFINIRSINLYTHRGLTIPIYTSLRNRNEVDLSVNVKEEKPVDTVSGELTTRLNSTVSVTALGDVTVEKTNKRKKDEDSEEEPASKKKRKTNQMNGTAKKNKAKSEKNVKGNKNKKLKKKISKV